jgi:hypothetical protein
VVLNIGTVIFTYGSEPQAILTNSPYTFIGDSEINIFDSSTTSRSPLQGNLMGVKRAVMELTNLADTLEQYADGIPTLALIDGSLILWSILGEQEFVIKELLQDQFLEQLNRIKKLAHQNVILASYLSYPDTSDVVNALRICICNENCSNKNPCTEGCVLVNGIRDRDLFIKFLPDKAVVANAARGDVINDVAMIKALKSGKVFALGLDVYNGEPKINDEYLKLDNLFLLPHLGSATKRTRIDMGDRAIDNLQAFFSNQKAKDQVN